ncbi:TRAP transporter substrate-binding protein [Palleronia sp.]|uniref:TRAP transporter substrate-binding protein n=1 Tax=Palleronia sp. TaxID=1940284 RepID=UPI0035C7E34D
MTLDVASTFPNTMPILGDVSVRLPKTVARLTDGALELRFHEPGALVPGDQTVNAVADRRVDAAWAGAGWFAERDSAFSMFSSVPFGPGIGEYMGWLYYGGGLELAREMFHAEGVHNIPCGLIPPEASGWFREEIRTVDDLVGLRMRFFGLGARVMQKHGVLTSQQPPGEILAEMRADRLDAAEFSLPAMDLPLGFNEVAPFYYFPGWHQQATLFDLYVNLDLWNELGEQHQAAIETACSDALRDMAAQGEAAQWSAMQQLQAEGVQLKRWPAEILVSFEDAWLEIVAEESEANENFRRVYESYETFRKNYALWQHFSFLR